MKILLLIIFAITFFITNVYENYFREKEKDLRSNRMTIGADKYGTYWHRMQWVNWFLTISFILYLHFDLSSFFIAVFLFSGALWWIMYDGILNNLKKRYFFFQSKYSTSDLESLGNLYVKLIYLFITIILLVITL